MKKGLKVFLLLVIIIIIAGVGGAFYWYTNATSGVTQNENKVVFEVKEGQTYYQIISKLKEAKLIKNELAAKVYSKIHNNSLNI